MLWRNNGVQSMANSEWINDDRTFCNQKCDAECYRNSNNIYYKNQPHSMADFRYTSECEKFFRKLTNYERIMSMSVKELAEFITDMRKELINDCTAAIGVPPVNVTNRDMRSSQKTWQQWLESEVEE